jgi:SNF2 family DNA or RNA helicase
MIYPTTKTTPWEHQRKALSLALEHEGFLIAHDMGAGKSKTAVDFCTAVKARKVLILAPLSVIDVWPNQFNIHSGIPHLCIPLIKGSVQARTDRLKGQMALADVRGECAVAILNYEAAWREPLGPIYNNRNRIIDKGFLISQEWDVVILDESHRIKSPGGKASWFCARLRDRARRRLCLTGTPMPHSPMDLYAQYRFLDPTVFGTSFVRFRAQYAIMGGFNNKQIVAYQNQDKLHTRLYSVAHRVTKDEVLDLPEVMHEKRRCHLSISAMKAYRSLEEDLIAKVGKGEVTVSNALVKLLRLQQITGGSIIPDGEERPEDIDKSKLLLLQDILEDLAPDEPVIVFTRFIREMARIREMAVKAGRKISELSGGRNELKEWQRGESSVLVVQIQTGGLGIDLTRSRYCVYYSLGFSLGDYQQSLARMHRPGQTRKCTYYHLVARDTIDEKVYSSLKAKKRVVEGILQTMGGTNGQSGHGSDHQVRGVGRKAA